MNKNSLIRICVIGVFHAVLYLYIIPYIVAPRFGSTGASFLAVTAIIISVSVLGTVIIGKKFKGEKHE